MKLLLATGRPRKTPLLALVTGIGWLTLSSTEGAGTLSIEPAKPLPGYTKTAIANGSAARDLGFGLAVADFNEDGWLDVITTTFDPTGNSMNNCGLRMYLRTPDGSFTNAGDYPISDATGLCADQLNLGLLVADFIGHDHLDVILQTFGYDGLTLLPGNGDGTFQAPRQLGVPAAGKCVPDAESVFVGFSPDDRRLLGGKVGEVHVWTATEDVALSHLFKAHGAPELSGIPPRDPHTPSQLIDLSSHYNASLTESWLGSPGPEKNDLAELPQGVHAFAGVHFDVRGLIQVGVNARHNYPRRVTGIDVGLSCQRLHLLHATQRALDRPGTEIGNYVVHFANGQTHDSSTGCSSFGSPSRLHASLRSSRGGRFLPAQTLSSSSSTPTNPRAQNHPNVGRAIRTLARSKSTCRLNKACCCRSISSPSPSSRATGRTNGYDWSSPRTR